MLERTIEWWRDWIDSLNIPGESRDAVVRAAIALKLNVVEDTGAIIAAMTTSIPESHGSKRNWDYRYCWLRDAYFVADALFKLGDVQTTRHYVDFAVRLVTGAKDARLAPMYTVTGGPIPEERVEEQLPGYRGMGPVRVGNQAFLQIQHDVYGEAILAALPLFTNSLLSGPDDVHCSDAGASRREAATLSRRPSWPMGARGTERGHTFSSVMSGRHATRSARIAETVDSLIESRTGAVSRPYSSRHPEKSWNADIGAFTAAMNGDTLDASLCDRTAGIPPCDVALCGHRARDCRDLRRGDFIYRSREG